MTILNCPECEQPVDSGVKDCPKCGYPIAEAIQQAGVVKTSVPNGTQPSKPVLPVLIGSITLLYAAILVWFYLAFAFASNQIAPGSSAWIFPAIAAFLVFLQIPGAIGVLLLKNWGRQLVQSTALGVIVIVALWIVYYLMFPIEEQAGMVGIAFITTGWPLLANLLLNLVSIKQIFGINGP